jgi:hypothetical protein
MMLTGCGSRASSSRGITPEEAFERLKPSSEKPLLCNTVNGYGCARLSLSTASGEQSLTHEDFLVSCQTTALGLSVNARDRTGVGAGLAFGFSLAGVKSFSAEKFVCNGLELTNDPVLAQWKEKSCQVYVRTGEKESWSVKDEPCTVTLEFVNEQWRGVVDCSRVSNGSQVWNFNDPAVFTCAK